MKRMILAATVLAMAGANLQTAKAGNHEWATAGMILTGVVAGAVITSAPAYCPPPRAVVYAPPRVVCPLPVVYAPPMVVYRSLVCAPPPVVVVNYGHHGGYRHGWGYSHCR